MGVTPAIHACYMRPGAIVVSEPSKPWPLGKTSLERYASGRYICGMQVVYEFCMGARYTVATCATYECFMKSCMFCMDGRYTSDINAIPIGPS